MPLGTEVGLGPGRIVLHGDASLPSQKRHRPQFSAMSIVAKPTSVTRTPLLVAANNTVVVYMWRGELRRYEIWRVSSAMYSAITHALGYSLNPATDRF